MSPHYKGVGRGLIYLFYSEQSRPQNLKKLFNPLTTRLLNSNFHPLVVVSRLRDPQLQVSEIYSNLTKWMWTIFKSC